MKDPQFTFDGDKILSIKTNQHVEIDFIFEDEYPKYVQIDGHEFAASEEMMRGLFVGVGDAVYSINDLAGKAALVYPDMVKEQEEEDADTEEHYRYVSSPYYTGRV